MYNFNPIQTTTEVSDKVKSLQSGIHEVEINVSFVSETNKEGNPYNAMDVVFSNENGVFKKRFFEATDAAKAEKDMKRFLHLFSAIIPAENIQNQTFTNLESMVGFFSKLNGNKLRVKLVPKYNNKIYTDTPNYFNGWAENIDVVETKLKFSESELKDIEEAKELRKVMKQMEKSESPVKTQASSDDLPF